MTAREQFLAQRQAGIGGSDVAAILGIHPYKTALDVWREKVEPVGDDGQSEPAYWGQVLEDVVAREWATRSGRPIQRVTSQIRSVDVPWMVANIDRAIVQPGTRARLDKDGRLQGADAILECKTASAFLSKDWGREEDEEAIPVHYAAQGMWYLAVTELQRVEYAVLIGGQKFVTKTMERDDHTIAILFERCRAFWVDHVQTRTPPAPQTVGDVLSLFPTDDGATIEADAELLDAYNNATALRAEIKALEATLEETESLLKRRLLSASTLAVDGLSLITWKAAKPSMKTDWQAVAQDLGAILGGPAFDEIAATRTESKPGSRRFIYCNRK